MCAKIIISTLLAGHMALFPGLDQDLRRPTLNRRGYADTRFNETQLGFIRRAINRTQRNLNPNPQNPKQRAVIHIGGAYGDMEKKILTGGGHVIYFDMEENHRLIAEDELDSVKIHPSQYETLTAEFPLNFEENPSLESRLHQLYLGYEITDIAAFAMFMYLSGEEQLRVLQWAYDLLPPGGRFYITGTSPFCHLFPGWDDIYMQRKQINFLAQYDLYPFPGWIPNVLAGDIKHFVPEGYLEHYTPFFHLLDPIVLGHHAMTIGFKVHSGKYLKRNYPQKLVYQGRWSEVDGLPVGEIASLILEKPTSGRKTRNTKPQSPLFSR